MTKPPDCAERCQAAEQKGYPACADECAWIERYSQGSGNPRNNAAILQAEHAESMYVSAMVKRDQLDGPSTPIWEIFGGYSAGFITSSKELNPNNLDRLRAPSALERKKR